MTNVAPLIAFLHFFSSFLTSTNPPLASLHHSFSPQSILTPYPVAIHPSVAFSLLSFPPSLCSESERHRTFLSALLSLPLSLFLSLPLYLSLHVFVLPLRFPFTTLTSHPKQGVCSPCTPYNS